MYFISWSQLFGYYMFLFHGHNYLDTICFYFMQYRTLSPSRDHRLQEVYNSRKSRKFFSETSLDMSDVNRK